MIGNGGVVVGAWYCVHGMFTVVVSDTIGVDMLRLVVGRGGVEGNSVEVGNVGWGLADMTAVTMGALEGGGLAVFTASSREDEPSVDSSSMAGTGSPLLLTSPSRIRICSSAEVATSLAIRMASC